MIAGNDCSAAWTHTSRAGPGVGESVRHPGRADHDIARAALEGLVPDADPDPALQDDKGLVAGMMMQPRSLPALPPIWTDICLCRPGPEPRMPGGSALGLIGRLLWWGIGVADEHLQRALHWLKLGRR